jgi:hypothetical protein
MIGTVTRSYTSTPMNIGKVTVWRKNEEPLKKPYSRENFVICLEDESQPFRNFVWYSQCDHVSPEVEAYIDQLVEKMQ